MSRPKEQKLTFYQGKQYSYDELLQIAHTQFDNPIPKFTLQQRLYRGMSVEEAIKKPVRIQRTGNKVSNNERQKLYREANKEKTKQIRARSKYRAYIRKYATKSGIDELLKITDERFSRLKHKSQS